MEGKVVIKFGLRTVSFSFLGIKLKLTSFFGILLSIYNLKKKVGKISKYVHSVFLSMNVQLWEISAMHEAFICLRNRMLNEISKTF